MAFCLTCFDRNLGLDEQIVLLLADVHGVKDIDAAACVRMPLPGFRSLLYRARTHMHAASCHCAIVRQPGFEPLVSRATGSRPWATSPASNARGATPHLPLRCGLDFEALRSLRRHLTKNLGR